VLITQQKKLIEGLYDQNMQQKKLYETLLLQVKYLTDRVAELENNQKKNSGNSSNPPSTDIGKVARTKSLGNPPANYPEGSRDIKAVSWKQQQYRTL
jgi:uncharacterized coiled-coil protein SlyX